MAAKMNFENRIPERLFENRTPYLDRTNEGDDLFKFRIPRSTVKAKRKWVVMRPDVKLWLLCVMVVISRCHGYQEQRFAMEPQDQSAIIGSRVTLPCRVENKAGTLQWTKDDFGLGTHRNLSGYERYRMIGSDEEGDYSLDIRDVTLDDDGQYQCQVSSGLNGEPAIRSRYAQLTVLVAPDPPRIIQGAFIDATEGQDLLIECVSAGGKPAAEITWVDGNQAVIKNNVENKVDISENGQTFTTRSVLRLTPSKDHHNSTITCQAQNTADRAFRVAAVQIEVKYVPKIKLSLKSETINDRIPEGTEARIGCTVDANPEAQIYRWYLNDNPVIGDYTDEMIIFNVTRKHNNAAVRCEVSNTAGQSSETLKLEVTFPPTFRSRPQNIEADDGSTVTLKCDVDGHPEPEIRWLYHEPGRIGQVKGKTSSLKVQVNNETAGRYICKATVEGYPEIESEASIFVKGVPKILSNNTQLGSEGDSVRVECTAFSVPKPDDISWYFEGREINAIVDHDYATVEESLSDGIVKSTLVIRASKSHHFGKYNCSITNEYGNANIAIVLKPLQTLPLLIIIIGVTSAVIIITGMVLLIVMCHKKRTKYGDNNKMHEKPDVTVTTSDMYKDSDRSSNISDLKPQLPGDGNYDLDYTSSEASTKITGGLPLAGPVPLRLHHDDHLLQFRYSNDYSDPAYSDPYHFKNSGYIYDYQPGYPHPPTLRVQPPNPADLSANNRSLQGSLTRSIDTSSTVPLTGGSQNNSLKRTNKSDETDAINSLGLPVGSDTPPTPIYAQPNSKSVGNGVDVRYAATYGNPYLRNSSMGFGGQVHTAKPTSTPAPPPYSSVRSSVVLPSGNGTQPAHATHV